MAGLTAEQFRQLTGGGHQRNASIQREVYGMED